MSSCTLIKDKLTKDFVDKGAINVGNNKIVNQGLFDSLNKGYAQHFAGKYSVNKNERPFNVEGNKAIPNEEYLNALDKEINPELAYRERFNPEEELSSVIAAHRQESTKRDFFSKLEEFDTRSREFSLNPTEDSIKTTEDKIARMQEVFNAAVVVDTELDASGALLGANHALTKANGKPTIVINPNKLFSDTVFHEFGHLYIDLLGGLQDPVVAQAVEQLRSSNLWGAVEAKYPELKGEDLAKEVLATALGIRGNDIYNNDDASESTWQKLKAFLLDKIRQLFGLEASSYDALQQIASEMLSGNVRLDPSVEFNTLIDQYSKLRIDTKDVSQESIDDLFVYLRKNYPLNEKDHTYSNEETGERYQSSATSLGQSLTVNKVKFEHKGDYSIALTDADMLTPNNINMKFDETVLPWSMDKAIQAFFNGEIGQGLLATNPDPTDYWYDYYNGLMEEPEILLKKTKKAITKNIDVINEEARRIEANKNKDTVMGNIVHNALEKYIKERQEGVEDPQFPADLYDTTNGDLKNTIKGIIDNGIANGSKFYTEQVLFNEASQLPGTADLIEITKEGKFRLYDFKTTKSFNNWRGHKKSDTEMYVESGYMNQLIIYATMLEEYNLKPADNFMNILSIRLDKDQFNPEEEDGNNVVIKEVRLKNIDPKHGDFNTPYRHSKSEIVPHLRSANKLSKFDLQTKEVQVGELVKKIQRGLEDYRGLTNAYGKFTMQGQVIADNRALYKLERDVKKYIGTNNSYILYKYIDNMRSALTNVHKYSIANNASLNPGYVQNMNFLLQAASFISDVKEFVEQSGNDFALEGKDKKTILELLTEVENQAIRVKKTADFKSKQLAVRKLAENSNIKQGYYAEQYEVEARKEGMTTKSDIYKEVYRKLQENEHEIFASEFQYWNKLMNNGYTDLRRFEQLLADPGMNKSQFVQVVKNILDKVDNDIRIDLDASIPDIVKWEKELQFKTVGDPKKVWGEFLEEAEHVTQDKKVVKYTHASVIPEFTSDYRELYLEYKYQMDYYHREIEKAYKAGKKSEADILKDKRNTIKELRDKALKEANQEQRVHPKFAALSAEKQEALRFIHEKLVNADRRLYAAAAKKLTLELWDGSMIYNLPRMRMSTVEAGYSADGTIKRFVSGVKDMFRPPADEDELGMQDKKRGESDEFNNNPFEDFNTKDTDILGAPTYEVPVFYRNELEDPNLQSFDIPTLLALNEETTIAFQHQKTVEADLYMITNALKNSIAHKTDALVANKVVDKVKDKFAKALKSEDNKVLKAVEASINNRFYKRSYTGTYSKWNYRAIKFGQALGGATSKILLGGNFRSATMTAIQGTLYRFIEGIAGENFSNADVVKGSQKAYKDIGNIIADTQKQFPTSKTNLLIRRFGLETQYKALVNKFVQQNFITKNLDESAMFAITTMAETMVTANLMYTLLGNIKVMNDNSDYIDKDGKVVSKEDAMSLDEAYEVVDGQLVLNENVVFTEKNLLLKYRDEHDGEKTVASTEISRYIRSIYADLFGQYNQDMKSMAEMTVIGNLAMSMRKWLPRGMHRRWRGLSSSMSYTMAEGKDPELADVNMERRFYSQDQKKFQEGYYTTGVRYMYSIYKEWKNAEQSISMMAAGKEVHKGLTFHERANLARALSELAIITLFGALSVIVTMIAKSLDDGDDDRDDDKLYYLAYIVHRIHMESRTFIDPFEMWDQLKNPASAMNTIKRVSDLIENLIDFDIDTNGDVDWKINDRYERGLRKGDLKIQKNVMNLVPWVKNSQQFLGILGIDSNETIKDSFEYMIR